MAKSKKDQELEAAAMGAMAAKYSPETEIEISGTLIAQAAARNEPIVVVSVDSIVQSPYQVKGEIDEAHVDELKESIAQEGILTPLLVRPISAHSMSTAKYELIGGHHRLEALRRLGWSSVPVMVKPMKDVEAARALTADNALHKALTDWQLFKHIQMLREVKAANTQRELAKVLACSATKIAYLEFFDKLPSATKTLLDSHPDIVGYNLMRDIKPFAESHPDTVEQAIQNLANGKLTQAGVVNWIKKQIEKPQAIYRREIALEGARAVYTDREARIVSDTIDFDKLHELIAENLDSLRKKSS